MLRTEPTEYERLLASLDESREHLRVMKVNGEQQNVDLAKAFYRMDSAAAAIRCLLAQMSAQRVRPALDRISA